MRQQIVIDIDQQGHAKVEVNGCTGRQCADMTRELEAALGATIGDEKKPEFHQGQRAGVGANVGAKQGA